MVHPNQTLDYWRGHINGLIIEQYRDLIGGLVADFGCGSNGFMTRILAELPGVNKVYGYDIGPVPESGSKKVIFEQADIKTIKGRSRFNAAISFHTLEHIKDPQYAVKRMAALMRLNSHLIVSVPFQNAYWNEAHINLFTVETLIHLIESEPFETIEAYRDRRVDLHGSKHNCITGVFRRVKRG